MRIYDVGNGEVVIERLQGDELNQMALDAVAVFNVSTMEATLEAGI